MLTYDHARTKEIVAHLVAIGNTVRWFIIIIFAIAFAIVAASFGGLVFGEGVAPLVAGILGLIIGGMLGNTFSAFVTIGIEWMAQMLVAQGEILSALKQDHK